MRQDRSLALVRRRALGGLALLAAPAAARAQAPWPDRPVTLVCCFPPGGSTDISARLVAPGLAEIIGKPVVVENRAGAGGNIGVEAVARSEPNGDTLLIVAAHQGHLETVQALLDRGADHSRVNKLGDTALDSALMQKHDDVARALLMAGAVLEP